MKIRPVVAELFNVEGQAQRRTDMKKLIVAFRNFAKAPKSSNFHSFCVLSTNTMNIDLNVIS